MNSLDSATTVHRLQVLDDFAAAYNRHDVDAIMAFMTEDCEFVSYFGPQPFGERFQGASAVRRRIASFLNKVPDARWDNVRHFVNGDRGVSQWIYSGTPPGANAPVAREGCDLFTFRDDKILVKDTFQKIVESPARPSRELIHASAIHKPVGRYAHAVRYKDLLFVSGCGPFDKEGNVTGVGDIVTQATRTLQNIKEILSDAGLTFANVIRETVYLTDINDGVDTRAVREAFYGEVLPAATLIEISRCAHPDMKIEIEVVAGF